jgi:Transposase
MTGVFRGEAKSDAKDARVIAETARLRSDLTVVTATDDLVVELTLLTGHRADLMADWVRGVNRLRDLLTSIFPALERAFDYSTRSALVLLTGFQTPAAIRGAGAEGVAGYLRAHHAWAKGIPAMADAALTAAQAQTVRLPGEATTAALIAAQAQACSSWTGGSKTPTGASRIGSAPTTARRSSSRCPGSARSSAPSSSWPPGAP